MSTNKTENYQLHLWEPGDDFLREEFNENNEMIDAAIKEQAAAVAAETAARETLAATVAKCGNCKIVRGSYTGTGTYGSSNPKTLTFSGRPLLLLVFHLTSSSMAIMGNPAAYGQYQNPSSGYGIILSWGSNSIAWHSDQSAEYQMNVSGKNYSYFALLAADE